jgi:AcrR family transcriptional regulator
VRRQAPGLVARTFRVAARLLGKEEAPDQAIVSFDLGGQNRDDDKMTQIRGDLFLAYPWPAVETFAVPSPSGSRRGWANESWESRYRRQHLELLDVAGQLAEGVGYDGTQISDIVREARVSKRAFYEHWNSKDACFADLIRRSRAIIIESMIEAAMTNFDKGPQISIAAMLDAWVKQLRTAPHLYTAMRGAGEPALAAAQAEGMLQIASIFGVAALRLGTDLRNDELTTTSRLFTWGAYGMLNPDSIYAQSVDRVVQQMSRTMCAGFGLGAE